MGFNLRGGQIADRTWPWQADATISPATALKSASRDKRKRKKKKKTGRAKKFDSRKKITPLT